MPPYRRYFECASEALVVVNPDGRILEINPAAERLFGYRTDELVAQPVEVLLMDSLRQIHQEHVAEYVRNPQNRPMGCGAKLLARRKDGELVPVEISLTYAAGTPRGDLIVAAVSDISRRLELETQARGAETINSLGTFAAGIAHDLNNPLQVIRSRTERLLQGGTEGLPSQLIEDLAAIHRQALHASQLVEAFFELAQRRRRKTAHTRLDINGFVQRTLLLVREQFKQLGIGIEAELETGLPPIDGDATKLERVLMNLLVNASEAMPNGGSIAVRTRILNDSPGWLCLSVTDTGTGIAADDLGKVFDLLYTAKPEGTGLGLWMCRRIVHEHNGTIEVRSELGQGTEFDIKLPLAHNTEGVVETAVRRAGC